MISFLSQWILILLSLVTPARGADPDDLSINRPAGDPAPRTSEAEPTIDPEWPFLPPPQPPEGPRPPKKPPVRPENISTTWSDIKTRFRGPTP